MNLRYEEQQGQGGHLTNSRACNNFIISFFYFAKATFNLMIVPIPLYSHDTHTRF